MTVYGLLMPVAGLLKVRYLGNKADIDSPFFKLHYRTTASILFMCCLLVTANDFFGNTINCISGAIPGNVLNNYCWIMSTFSVPDSKGVHGEDFAYPGVEPPSPDEEERTYHAYYQWVPFVLFFMGILFYMPHYVWKTLEDRKMDKITNGLRGRSLDKDERKEQCEVLVKYVRETFHLHNFYAFKYFVCDILNLINVFVQMYLLNRFLGNVFFEYGPSVLYYDPDEEQIEPMMRVFPRVTKCHFHKYGPSGTIEQHDAMCVLALNIVNEKIFLFLWFWFIVLAVMTVAHMVYVLGIIALPAMRKNMVEDNAKGDKNQIKVSISAFRVPLLL